MKHFGLLILMAFFCLMNAQAKSDPKDIPNQLIRNLHGGCELHTVDGVSSYSGYVGTGYYYYLDKHDRLYINPAVDVKWGEYRSDNGYSMKTTSVAIPITVGYKLFQTDLIAMDVYGGARYEQILNVEGNDYPSKVNTSQLGLTGGTALRFFNKFSINASYYYGLTSLFADGTGKTTSFNFSFNF
jgi:hypothetical protein